MKRMLMTHKTQYVNDVTYKRNSVMVPLLKRRIFAE
jgi:hypothetical protein